MITFTKDNDSKEIEATKSFDQNVVMSAKRDAYLPNERHPQWQWPKYQHKKPYSYTWAHYQPQLWL